MKKMVFCNYAKLIRKIAQEISDERAAKCGYDLMLGLAAGNSEDRAKAWETYLVDLKNNNSTCDEERDGVWVPAIPVSWR